MLGLYHEKFGPRWLIEGQYSIMVESMDSEAKPLTGLIPYQGPQSCLNLWYHRSSSVKLGYQSNEGSTTVMRIK